MNADTSLLVNISIHKEPSGHENSRSRKFCLDSHRAVAEHRPTPVHAKGTAMTADSQVTRLLMDWNGGDESALEQLLPLVYGELQHKARQFLRKERGNHTLQPTALVHEAYFRLVDQHRVSWRNRAHFFGLAAQMMRRILVDHARRSVYAKRGGGAECLPLDEAIDVSARRAPDLVALDDCLIDLAEKQPDMAKLVELRYFGGLSNEEIGEAMGISAPTVTRRWRVAKAWIYSGMTEGADHEG